MAIPLRYNTAREVRIGMFVDVTDGITPETGVTLASCDTAALMKANGASIVSLVANTWTAATASGWYSLALASANTDTLGELVCAFVDTSAFLPVWAHFTVQPQMVWDALHGSADMLQVDTVQIQGATTTATALGVLVNGVTLANDAITLSKFDETTAWPLVAADSGATQVARVGADGDTLETLSDEIAAVKADTAAVLLDTGTDGVVLANDAITSAKYDESTAFPIKSTDTGATQIARVGADSDTLETLSDEIAAVKADTTAVLLDTGTDGVVLANDAITSAKYDESTAFPLASADTGATEVARTGADGDTLEVLSDQIDTKADGIPVNVAFSNIPFLMVDSTDHRTPKTGLTIVGYRSIDSGAFATVTGAIASVGSGIYQLDASQADMNGENIMFRMTGSGADDCFFMIRTTD